MTRVDETVAVSVNQAGEPIAFQWRNQSYLVKAKPTRWFARRAWWVESARAHRGIGAGVLEIEMWRLFASQNVKAGAQVAASHFELVHTTENNRWQLVRVFQQ
ncbi:MAG: DUF6504 family protein [Micrococcales bacterium]